MPVTTLGASPDRAAFAKVVEALDPYLDALVFVGGWAHLLYGLAERSRQLPFEPLHTDDADIAAPLELELRGERIADLLKSAGFQEELKGEDRPPISEYHLGLDGSALYVEFVAPINASGRRRRGGGPDDTVTLAGVTAQKLRYIEFLLESPWRVTIGDAQGFPLSESRTIQIPNPACYLAQKLLVLPERITQRHDGKDALYIHDTLLLFGTSLPELRSEWRGLEGRLPAGLGAKIEAQISRFFGTTNASVEKATAIARASGRPSPPTPEALATVCRVGLGQIFSERV